MLQHPVPCLQFLELTFHLRVGFSQRRFGPLARSDIPPHRDEVSYVALSALQRGDRVLHVEKRTVLPAIDELDMIGLA